ncbi:hypothetical protein HGM15179_006810 [Zosterops borbonicus]|uniref:LITAF domain-containing protein n=1 Tax=Zosterops borbonicus TaxID=364589 RepID=A0A8K1GMD2_9PASS|nr:hypothetical protein HGM15179_006810 [Zosterops borbonicus]
MAREKQRREVPTVMYEPHYESYRPEPSAPPFGQEVYLVPQPPIIVAGIFSSKPTSTICPSCRQHITTQVTYRLGKLSYLLCTSLCMVGIYPCRAVGGTV